jgi:ligand-binding sensor domain-containing protein
MAQLHHTRWTPQDGAPGQITALAQTADGYLWIGTTHGVFRFDGIRFQSMSHPTSAIKPQARGRIYSMNVSTNTKVWVGY